MKEALNDFQVLQERYVQTTVKLSEAKELLTGQQKKKGNEKKELMKQKYKI